MAVVNGYVECVVIRLSDNKIINPGFLVLEENMPPQMDAGYKAYAKYEPLQPAPIDARLYKIQTTYETVETDHPDYPGIGQYKITHTEIPRSNEEKIQDLEAIEIANNSFIDNGYKMEELTQIVIPILVKKIDRISLETWENEVVTNISNVAAKKKANEEIKKLKKAAIENNEFVDLDSGWITS